MGERCAFPLFNGPGPHSIHFLGVFFLSLGRLPEVLRILLRGGLYFDSRGTRRTGWGRAVCGLLIVFYPLSVLPSSWWGLQLDRELGRLLRMYLALQWWDHEPWVAGKSPRTQMVVEHRTGLRMKVVFHFLWVEREATGAGEGAQAW